MKYTAGQAAKATGVATATITRALKSGRISGQKDTSGAWMIDPSELHRVFPPVSKQDSATPNTQDHETPERGPEISALEREVQTLREALSDAREDRDKWRDMAERLSLASPPKASSHGFWSRLTRKP